MGQSLKRNAVCKISTRSAKVRQASEEAARLIEAAMLCCGQDDIPALDCLLEARRALSPIIDDLSSPPPSKSLSRQ